MLQKLRDNLISKRNYFSPGSIVALATLFTVLIVLGVTMHLVGIRKVVTVEVDGKKTSVISYENTVKKILEQNKIGLGSKDKIEPSVDTKVKNGQNIYIKRAVGLEILVDGKDLKIKSAENSVKNVLKTEKISLNATDKLNPYKGASVKKGMKIVITRVTTKTFTELQPIAFNTVVNNDDTMASDENKVVQQGSNGAKEIQISATYEDGKEVSRNVVSEVVKSTPVDAVIKRGTLGVVSVNRGGRTLFKTKITALATGYTDDLRFGITASGAKVKRDANGYSSVAVDPRVIPLGTKLYITGYGYGIAEDTGGLIKGNRVDLFFNNESDCYSWGAKSADVYILN
ncbi:3D domain-containing protein [Clostridium akagii]|uniref:3D domain-containing protein n=1 Tax=Clostridium akagii TaxID=91623 RepID=UPI00047BCB10|nr:3D domain-containing protein [Clostridium akagii]